jgi:hypothetical protein
MSYIVHYVLDINNIEYFFFKEKESLNIYLQNSHKYLKYFIIQEVYENICYKLNVT